MKKIYDIIVIRPGCIGLPTAYNLAKTGMKVLVLETGNIAPDEATKKLLAACELPILISVK